MFIFNLSRYFLKSLGAVRKTVISGMSVLVQAASLRKFLSSERATSEMVGQMMLLAVTIIGIGTITVYGVPTILSLQELANARNGGQSMMVVDSQASKAIIGFSPSQTNSINLGGGNLTVMPNSSTYPSYITVSSNNFSFTIPLGKIEYMLGNTIVTYEGGGMWTKYPSGSSLMLSPPALHYNGVMLSLPAINISGNGSVAGEGVATLSVTKKPPVVVFPNTSIITGYQTVQVPQTNTTQWLFNSSTDWSSWGMWASSAVTWNWVSDEPNWGGTPNGSASVKLTNNSPVNTTYTSPTFYWGKGTPTSARLDFDWELYSNTKIGQSSFSVMLVKPDGNMSQIYPTTAFNSTTPSPGWYHYSNTTISVNDFNLSGNYQLKLNATLNPSGNNPTIEVRWDNPNITLNYNTPSTVPVYNTNRTNPVNMSQAGYVYVNITSDFYDAWATYAGTLGYVNVTTNTTTHTTSLNLSNAPHNLGEYTSITNPIVFNGLPDDSTPLDNFSFMLVPFGGKMDWDIRTKTGQQKLIFDVTGTNPVSLNVGYEDDGSGYIKPAETWNYTGNFPVQNGYIYIDMLNTSLYLTYNNKTVSASNPNSCQPFGGVINPGQNKFNSTGFSWPLGQTTTPQTWNSSWPIDSSNEIWTGGPTGTTWFPSYTGNTPNSGFNASDGNPTGSIYFNLSGKSKSATTYWTSPNFSWNNGSGILTSAYISFDWKVATYSSQGNFYVILVKPDGSTSQIYPTTTFSGTSGWSHIPAYNIPVSNFTQNGNYSIQLVSTLNTGSGGGLEEIRWDNPNITLNYNVTVANSLTQQSLYNITEHYFGLMNQNGDLSFGDCGPYQPAANSTMLMNYVPTGGLIYLQISDNQVDAAIN